MLIGNLHGEQATIQERFATAIGSAPLLLGDLRKLSAADRKWYHEKISWFKEIRRSTKISESFFPLGSWLQPTPAAWDGFARVDRNGKGVLALFPNKSSEPDLNLKLPLLPTGSFKLQSVFTGKEVGTFTKADWVRGVPISLSNSATVEVFEITPVSR
jgi:alpha-galactosidase